MCLGLFKTVGLLHGQYFPSEVSLSSLCAYCQRAGFYCPWGSGYPIVKTGHLPVSCRQPLSRWLCQELVGQVLTKVLVLIRQRGLLVVGTFVQIYYCFISVQLFLDIRFSYLCACIITLWVLIPSHLVVFLSFSRFGRIFLSEWSSVWNFHRFLVFLFWQVGGFDYM